jgi:hypothetical protein
VERAQGVQGIIECLVFFDRVRASGEKFPCPGHDRFLGFGDSRRKPVVVGLEQSGGVKLSPGSRQG